MVIIEKGIEKLAFVISLFEDYNEGDFRKVKAKLFQFRSNQCDGKRKN